MEPEFFSLWDVVSPICKLLRQRDRALNLLEQIKEIRRESDPSWYYAVMEIIEECKEDRCKSTRGK